MDPIRQGTEIFNKIHQEIGKNLITDTREFETFLNNLISQTAGLVIVDFLDAGNWDNIKSFEINHETRRVNINWHDYRKAHESDEDKNMRSMVFPGDVDGLTFDFQELRLIKIGDISIFSFRGYAVSSREVEKIMKKDTEQFKLVDDSDNFSVETVRKINGEWQTYKYLNTPIFSTLIIPKDLNISASISKKILFAFNLDNSKERINKVDSDLTTGEDEIDFICEKANTLRRIMENILKIECCYRYRQIRVKKSYSELLLGDLVGLIKDFRSEAEKSNLNSIVRLANELSHDSGKLVTKGKALQLVTLVKDYCEALDREIYANPNPHFDF